MAPQKSWKLCQWWLHHLCKSSELSWFSWYLLSRNRQVKAMAYLLSFICRYDYILAHDGTLRCHSQTGTLLCRPLWTGRWALRNDFHKEKQAQRFAQYDEPCRWNRQTEEGEYYKMTHKLILLPVDFLINENTFAAAETLDLPGRNERERWEAVAVQEGRLPFSHLFPASDFASRLFAIPLPRPQDVPLRFWWSHYDSFAPGTHERDDAGSTARAYGKSTGNDGRSIQQNIFGDDSRPNPIIALKLTTFSCRVRQIH